MFRRAIRLEPSRGSRSAGGTNQCPPGDEAEMKNPIHHAGGLRVAFGFVFVLQVVLLACGEASTDSSRTAGSSLVPASDVDDFKRRHTPSEVTTDDSLRREFSGLLS